ncbi:NAD(P)-dependent oxidoreductase [Streptomyces antnestii]|uniref:NAD(P)-dependent oxidoreductase n=2 Tax=Streptomyces antnestii TaxID=2494256 RepID=A0A437Q387_9ACTN|nr:NAD(P)-dependent oxidoreductase [Streptomyces sp. San01]
MTRNVRTHAVVVLGCGLMGAAVARTLARTGTSVAAWNRTHSKAVALADDGVTAIADIHEAVRAAPLIIAVTADYEALWSNIAGATGWQGATLVNLATGTPDEADRMHARITAMGARYLDGMAACYPEGIGSPEAFLSYAGSPEAWAEYSGVLRRLGGQTHHVAADPRVSMLMSVWYSAFYVPALAAYVEAVGFAADQGISREDIDTLTPLLIDLVGHAAPEISAAVTTGEHATDQATIDTFYDGSVPVLNVMHDAGHHARMYSAALASMSAARELGLGDQGYSALATCGISRPVD